MSNVRDGVTNDEADAWLEREAKWSLDQHEIFQWFEYGTGNMLVRARAGCGKTSTIEEAVKRVGMDQSVLLAAFNKSIAEELQSRVNRGNVEAKTLHGLGFAFVRRNWKVQVDGMRERAWQLAEQATTNAPTNAKKLVRDLHTKAREVDPWLALENASTAIPGMIDLAGRFDIMPDERLEAQGWTIERCADAAHSAMLLARERCGAIDFADMIFLPLVHGWVQPWFDLVVVDEAQDMTTAQLTMACAAARRTGRIAAVGDDRQCIYQFRGAEIDGLDRLKSQLAAGELGLKTTYRCGRAIVALAAQYVPDFVAAAGNPEGEIASASGPQMIREAKPGDFVLSRKNAPLIRVCVALLKRGVRARIKGSDISKRVLALVEDMNARDVAGLEVAIREWARRESEKAIAKMSEEAAAERCAQVGDLASIVLALLEDVSSLAAFDAKARELFADNPGDDVVMCSSVHRAKGLEASTVYLLRDTFQEGGGIEEDNIRYVAITRAKHRLVWVAGEVT